MLRNFVDLVACLIQVYICSEVICILFPIKENRSQSFWAIYGMQMVSYFVVNYIFYRTSLERLLCGIVIFAVGGLLAFDGSRIRRMRLGLFTYFTFFLVDVAVQFLMFPSYVIVKLIPVDQKMFGRNLATLAIFVVYIVCEMFFEKREERQSKSVMTMALGMAVAQLVILNVLLDISRDDLLANTVFLTAISSLIMMGGFLVVNELSRQMITQEKKRAELEQMTLEQQYQYDYYKKAYEQSEEIRDIRHDMRNQLQTVEVLLQSEEEKDRKRAKEMIQQLSGKVV